MTSGALLALALAGLGAVAIAALALWIRRLRRDRARLHAQLERTAAQLENLQLAFSRFAPEEVIERVIASGVSEQGEKKEVTVLFADLVGFTALSEKMNPTVLVTVLNGYFERSSRAISQHRGHVATFVGDGIVALFGALAPNPWQANDAVHAALALRAAIADYSGELERDGLPPLSVGVGLHRGQGVAGLVGSRDLKTFTVMGQTVNLAARVQELTRQLPADVIVTETLRRTLDPRFRVRKLPPATVKGVSEPLEIHAVDGFAEGDALPGDAAQQTP